MRQFIRQTGKSKAGPSVAAWITFASLTAMLGVQCSWQNRDGPEVTCADLGNGVWNACGEGVLASCDDGEVSYEACADPDGCNSATDVCDSEWQVDGHFRCAQTEELVLASVSTGTSYAMGSCRIGWGTEDYADCVQQNCSAACVSCMSIQACLGCFDLSVATKCTPDESSAKLVSDLVGCIESRCGTSASPGATTACGFDWGSSTCASCVQSNCCAQSNNCSNDPTCVDCATREPSAAQCVPGQVPTYDAFLTCLTASTGCQIQCG